MDDTAVSGLAIEGIALMIGREALAEVNMMAMGKAAESMTDGVTVDAGRSIGRGRRNGSERAGPRSRARAIVLIEMKATLAAALPTSRSALRSSRSSTVVLSALSSRS